MNAPIFRCSRCWQVPCECSASIITFKSPEAFFDYVRGPRQHDAHLDTRRKAIWLQEQLAFCDGAEKRVREWVKTL